VIVLAVSLYAAPLVVGAILHRLWPRAVAMLERPLSIALVCALVVLFALLLLKGIPAIVAFGAGPASLVLAFVATTVAVAHLFGGPTPQLRITLATMLAARFPMPAMIIAKANGAEAVMLPLAATYVLGGILLVWLYARVVRGRPAAPYS
jgi:BASS family bile acid:Na+ symporter